MIRTRVVHREALPASIKKIAIIKRAWWEGENMLGFVQRKKRGSVGLEALQSGNRLRPVSKLGAELDFLLVKEQGLAMAESARQLSMSKAAIAKTIRK